jgi:hypothetical protein
MSDECFDLCTLFFDPGFLSLGILGPGSYALGTQGSEFNRTLRIKAKDEPKNQNTKEQVLVTSSLITHHWITITDH